MLSAEVEKVLSAAFAEARGKRLEFINIDYLLLHLLGETTVNDLLTSRGADISAMERHLRTFVHKTVPVIEEDGHETEAAPSMQRVLDRAVFLAESWRHPLVAGLHVLHAILAESGTEAVTLLNKHGIARETVGGLIESAAIFRAGEESATSAAAESRLSVDSTPGDTPEPFRRDQLIRNAILACWQSLPANRRTPDALDKEVFRLTRRALRDFREDFEAAGDYDEPGDDPTL